ncbi:tetratricopeptide repeat protein, partial [Thermoleptolyngbya sp. M55_K2018_002]|uniref:tetratricopeptide repeat protein n=1 Tax=Thermoleptolyngbya sp. M55_K2018_002 TaxID=2747808 RepID=UPI001A093967
MTLPSIDSCHSQSRSRSWLLLFTSLIGGLSLLAALVGQSAQAQAPNLPQTLEAATRQDEADRLLREGVQAYSASQFAVALDRWQAALAIYQELGDRPGRTVALTNIGEAHRSLGQYAEAIAAFTQALPIAQETGDRRRQGLILGNLGVTYYATGDYTLALENLQQAQAIAQDVGDREGIATALLNQAVVYRALGQPEEADRRVQQARTAGGEGEVASQPAGETMTQLERELRIAQEQGDRQGEAAIQGAIGVLWLNQRQYDRAIAAMQSQLDIAREIGDRSLEATALNNLGLVHVELQQYPQAMDMLQDSLLVKQEIGDREGEARTLANLGRLFLEQDQPAMAIVFLKQAVNLWEALRAGLQQTNPDIQQTYTDRVASTYRLLADLLLRQDRVLEAQQVLDLLKVQELDDYLRDVRGNEQTGRGIALSEEERNMLNLYDRAIAQG